MPAIEIHGTTLFYEEKGAGEPVVLIHGFPLSSKMWRPQQEGLRDQLRVITPDLRGMGQSSVPTSGYSMDVYAADIVALLDHLELDRVFIGGMSMGGYVALAMLRHYGERIKGLILIDTQAEADDAKMRAKRHKLIEQVRTEGARAIADTSKMLSEQTHAENPALVQQMRSIMEHTAVDGIVGALNAMIERPDSTVLLETTDIPALIIVGRDDPLTPPDDAAAMQRAVGRAELHVLDGAAHAANLERSEEVNRAIKRWVAQVQ
jgi:pimeloyl-ACP methyl ester carboxylesterase